MSEIAGNRHFDALWAEIRLLLEWQSGFGFYLVFSDDPRTSLLLRTQVEDTARDKVLQWMQPSSSKTAAVEVLHAALGDENGFYAKLKAPLWIELTEAPEDPDWQQARRETLSALNKRRGALERLCSRPMFMQLPLAMAPEIVTYAPDLWSIRQHIAVLPNSDDRSTGGKTVFISYAHDSDDHRKAVIALAAWLRARGVTVVADDQFVDWPPPAGWKVWLRDSIESADIVLMVCSARYRDLFDKHTGEAGKANQGTGAVWEGAIIAQEVYERLSYNHKFFPILSDDGDPGDIPEILKPWESGHRFPSGNAGILNLITGVPVNVGGPRVGGIFNLPAARLAPFYADPLGNLPRLYEHLHTHGGSVIFGMGGVGKTQLALQFCHAHRFEYAGVWWFRAETPALLAEDCRAFCVAVGIDPTSAPQRAMRAWLTQQPRWLLVYDGAETEADLSDFLPADGPHHVLITSRQPQWRGVESFSLDVWSADEALVFLRKHLPTHGEADLRLLSDSLGGLPLALEQACAYLLKMQGGLAAVARYAAEIDASTRGLSLLERNDSALAKPVLATLSLAFDSLGAPARVLLELCGWLGPKAIPEFLFTDAPELLPKALQAVARDPARWRETVAELSGFALCKVEWVKTGVAGAQGAGGEEWSALGLHRLTQAAVRAATLRQGKAARTGATKRKREEANTRAKRAGGACQRVFDLLFAAFPAEPEHWRHWPRCQALAAHVQKIEEWHRQGWIGDARYPWLLDRLARYWEAGPALYGEARRLYETSLAIRRERLGAEHPATLSAISNLAGLLRSQGDFAAARPLQEQVLECRTRLQGPEHPATLTAMHNLSLTLQDLNELQAARRLQETALEICKSTLGPEHPDTLHAMLALAWSLFLQGELAEARVLQEKVLPIYSRVLGADHPGTLSAMQHLAGTLNQQGALAEARVLQEQVLQSRRALQGPAHPQTVAAMHNLATTLHRQGETLAARDLIDQALALSTRVLGPQHPETLKTKAWRQTIHGIV